MHMKHVTLAVLCTLLVTSGAVAQNKSLGDPGLIPKQMVEAEQEIRASEKRQEWKKIQWRTNAADALAEARRLDKPILVVLVVGEAGQKNAKRC